MLLYLLLLLPVLWLLSRLLSRRRRPVGPPPRVTVSTGKIEGAWSFSSYGRQFASFSGVPYARPPVGSLRFQRPQPAEAWEGVRSCVKDRTFIQRNVFRPGSPEEGREDGLMLNVYSHNCAGITAKAPLPVLVWLHGGGYVSGSGSRKLYGADLLMDREVVVVSLNYRVSVLGGLYLEGGAAPGNQGMRDQVLGLQWVQQNIARFGGDPGRVTIFGESAGGISVTNHLLSPMSAGLFHAAIVQSGSPLSPFAGVDKHPAHYARKLAEKHGAPPGAAPEEILELLQGLPAGKIQGEAYMFEENSSRAPFPFKPIVDGGLVEDPFLPEEPLELLRKGNWNKVPLILGTNKDEGLLIKAFFENGGGAGKYEEARASWDTIGPLAFFHRERDEVSAEETALCQAYRKKHFGAGAWAGEGPAGRALVQMYGDLMFAAPADLLAKALTARPGPPVYHYLYSHQGPLSLYSMMTLRPWQMVVKLLGLGLLGRDPFPAQGVCHADELFMLFKVHALPVSTVRSEADRRVSRSLLDMWTDFATHHNPTPRDGTWQRFDPSNPKYLEIGSGGNKMEYPEGYRERMDEWAGIWKTVPCTMKHAASKTWTEL